MPPAKNMKPSGFASRTEGALHGTQCRFIRRLSPPKPCAKEEGVLHQDAAVVPRKYFILSGGTSALERNDPEHTHYRLEWGHPGPVFG